MEPKNKTLKNRALAIALTAVSAASAFGAFFSPNTARAEEKCSVGRATGKFDNDGIKEVDGMYRVKLGNKVAIIPTSFIADLSPQDRGSGWYSNLKRAQTGNKGKPWTCIAFDGVSSNETLPTREIPDTSQPPKQEIKKEGKWISATSFKKTPPLTNNGKPYGINSALDMLKTNRQWLNQIFERALKRDVVGGKVDVKIIVGNDGTAQKILFSGKEINAEIVQMYSDFFGRVKWSAAGEVKFPLILTASK